MELGNDEVGTCIAIIYTCSRFLVSVYEFICLKNLTSSVEVHLHLFSQIRDIMQHFVLILYSTVKGTHKNP